MLLFLLQPQPVIFWLIDLGVNRLIFRTLSPKKAVQAKRLRNLSRYIPRTEVNDLYIQVHEAPVSRTRGHTRRYWHRSL